MEHNHTRDYYRRLRRLLFPGVLTAFMAPLVILSVYFHFQFNLTLKESGKLHLVALAESQRNTIDLFLQERVVNIFNLFHGSAFSLSPSSEDMQLNLRSLRETSDAFVDVGFLDESGEQIGYAGPYLYLHGRNYSAENWFKTLMSKDRNYHISDIYLGFRRKPHFTIAVRQLFEGKPYVMRATLDPDKFYLFMRMIVSSQGGDSALVNGAGRYQVVDPGRGDLLGLSDYVPSAEKPSGVSETAGGNRATLVAHAWLQEAPWALVVRQPLKVAYAKMYRVRRVMIVGMSVLAALLLTATWLVTDRLLKRAEATDRSRRELKSQLIHAAKLASAGELAAGVAHEINNPLAIISTQSGLIRDMLDPAFAMEWTPDEIRKELGHIDEAVFRARDITAKLLGFVRRNESRLVPCDVNAMIDDVVGGLIERELLVSDIELARDLDHDLPAIMLDPDQVRQVLLNVINNAGDAIRGAGTITITTKHDQESVRITVADTGKGMSPEQVERIFLPFYTTKEEGKGTGLGLSISLSIVESMGGKIEVQSMPGAGSSFAIVLPINQQEENRNGRQHHE
ncbi:MAG: ATP-binding protein [Pseudomonadota bacterium]